ncbi:MAG: MBL fold metallo-hydrolase, partial [Actinomycetota bacterium]
MPNTSRRALAISTAAILGMSGLATTNASSNTLVATRTKFFGAANVDQVTGEVRADRVIMSWVHNASFVAAFNGTVVLFDAFFPDHNPGYIPTTPY